MKRFKSKRIITLGRLSQKEALDDLYQEIKDFQSYTVKINDFK